MRILSVSAVLITFLVVPWGILATAGDPAVNSHVLAGLEFQFKGDTAQRAYLGIGTRTNLSITEISADRLIIAVFNTFCSVCQEDAEALNLMYQLIEETPSLKGKTKLVGIAAGNTDMEVEQYRIKYQVPFPLFADTGFAIGKAIPENLRTPLVITTKMVKGEPLEVVMAHSGSVENLEQFLGVARRSAMLEPGPEPRVKN